MPLLILNLFALTAFAGTVTLTGTCVSKLNSNNTINFSISNSGTDSASGLFIQSFPAFSNITTGYYYANQITPEGTAHFAINSSISNSIGTFIYYFIATYQEGTQLFTVVFPCSVKNSETYSSMAGISNVSVKDVNSSTFRVTGSIYSFSQSRISGNIVLIAPPELKRQGSAPVPFSISPYQYSNFTFYGNLQPGNSTYSGAVALEYAYNGINYGSLDIISINPYQPGPDYLKEYAAPLAVIAAVIMLLLLVLRQRLIKRKRTK